MCHPRPYIAGLIARSDNENGFWWSPSNQEIYGIVGTARPVDFTMDFLMAKRAAQFPDHDELEALRTLGETVRQRCLEKQIHLNYGVIALGWIFSQE